MPGLNDGLSRALVRELHSDVSANRRNAAFACGTLLSAAAQAGGAAQVAGHLPSLLQVVLGVHTTHEPHARSGIRPGNKACLEA